MTTLPPEISQLFDYLASDLPEVRAEAIISLRPLVTSFVYRQDQYEDLFNALFQMARADARDDVVRIIVETATRLTNAEAATYFTHDAAHHTLIFSTTVGAESATLAKHTMPADKGVVGESVRTKEPLIVVDAAIDSRIYTTIDATSGFITRSLACVPVLDRSDRVLGVIEVLNKRDGVFDEHDIDILALLAQHVALTELAHAL